jgi:hypothetical protein
MQIQRNVLVRIAERVSPFMSPDGRAFAQVPAGFDNARVSHPVRSDAFRAWFDCHYFVETDRGPSIRAFHDFCRHVESRAVYGPERGVLPVYRRTASLDGSIVIDLANPEGEYIEITADGHRIHRGEAGPPFETSATTQPLPEPVPPSPGDPDALDQLRRLLHLDGHPWMRVLCWLLSALRSAGPIPILILRGPTRSGKSFAARILRTLVDPNAAPFTPTPRSAAHLLKLARQNWVLAFDHVANLSPALSDTLCRLSTGATIDHRDAGHSEHNQQWIRRPILLTVTDHFVPSPDLAARALIVDLAALDAPRSERDLADEFTNLHPRVLEALCSALSRALKAGPSAFPTDALPEIAAALAAPQPAHPFVRDVLSMLSSAPTHHWEGTAEQLLLLIPAAETPKGLSQAINNHMLALSKYNIRITRDRKTRRRLLILDLDFDRDASYKIPTTNHLKILDSDTRIFYDGFQMRPTPLDNSKLKGA